MAGIHNQLTRGPWTIAAKAALGDSKTEGGIERYGETLQPVFDLWSRPEWAILRNERLWWATTSQAGVVAEFSFGAIVNPVGSNHIVTVTELNVRCNAQTDFVGVGINTEAEIVAQAGVTAQVAVRDSRAIELTSFGRSQVINGASTAVFTNETESWSTTSHLRSWSLSMPVVLHPGFGVTARHTVVNLFLACNFAGYERPAFRGEL